MTGTPYALTANTPTCLDHSCCHDCGNNYMQTDTCIFETKNGGWRARTCLDRPLECVCPRTLYLRAWVLGIIQTHRASVHVVQRCEIHHNHNTRENEAKYATKSVHAALHPCIEHAMIRIQYAGPRFLAYFAPPAWYIYMLQKPRECMLHLLLWDAGRGHMYPCEACRAGTHAFAYFVSWRPKIAALLCFFYSLQHEKDRVGSTVFQ